MEAETKAQLSKDLVTLRSKRRSQAEKAEALDRLERHAFGQVVRQLVYRYGELLEMDDTLQMARIVVCDMAKRYDKTKPAAPYVNVGVKKRIFTSMVLGSSKGRTPPGGWVPSLDRPPTSMPEDAGMSFGDTIDNDRRRHNDPPPDLDTKIAAARMYRALKNLLSPIELAAYVGVMVNGDSYEELGRRHGVSGKAIDNAKTRAVRKISEHKTSHPDAQSFTASLQGKTIRTGWVGERRRPKRSKQKKPIKE